MSEDRNVVVRVCAALIRNDSVLMVRHVEPDDDYWTLPGGKIESGETPEEAVVREFAEETGIEVSVTRPIWECPFPEFSETREVGFLVEADLSSVPSLGFDPEQSHLPQHARVLQGVAWCRLDALREDVQVSKVLAALS